jgi:acyl-coenzyme A thioesterase PaaI-like protein
MSIRERVLRAIALNREPGFHFAGNLAGISFETTAAEAARVTLEAGPWCTEADGQVSLGFAAMLVDMALSASIRANLPPATRMATVSLTLQLTGAPLVGALEAIGEFQGFLGAGEGRQALARVRLSGASGLLGIAQAAFMPLDPPPGVAAFPLPRNPRAAPVLSPADLDAEERRLLRHADACLADGEAGFVRRLLGYEPRRTKSGAGAVMKNGAHVGNRVGHAQGGLLMGLAAATACAALPARWTLSSIHALFVSPGQGKALRARSKVIHQGLMTAVARTEIVGPGGRRVLDATTAHARR